MADAPRKDSTGTVPPGSQDAPGPLAQAVTAINAALDDLANSSWLGASPTELGQALTGLTRAAARLSGAQLQVAAECDRAGVGSEVGASSMAAWWANETRATRRAARSAVKLAHDTAPGGPCPLVGAALADGLVLEDQARVIVKAVADLPSDLDPAVRELAEKTLVDLAGQHDADDLRHLGRGILLVVAPDVAEEHERTRLENEERRAWEEVRFSMTDDGHGMTHGRFTIPTAQAHQLRKFLLAFLHRQRRADNAADNAAQAAQATAEAERAAAGTVQRETAQPAAAESGEPTEAPARPNDGGSTATSKAWAWADGSESPSRPEHTEHLENGSVGHEAGEFSPECRDQRSSQDRAEARVGPRGLGDAFVALIESIPADCLPRHGGLNPTLVVTMTLDQLTGISSPGGAGAHQPVALDTGVRVTPGQARRWACSAGIIPAVLGTGSVPLDLGRQRRYFSARQHLAMAIRDQGCMAVGCDRPPAMCDAHHLEQWARDHGRSDLAKGCLLCWHHHRLIHDSGYRHVIRPDRRITFTRTSADAG